jgi:AAA+ ATPase superfamily predicted ATPase
MHQNPFYTRKLPLNAPFCNRTKELDELENHTHNNMNVVLFSPRRYGKTSLIKRVLARISKKGVITIYADMYGVTSQGDIAERMAKAIYDNISQQRKLFDKAVKWLFSWRPVARVDDEPGVKFSVDRIAGQRDEHLIEEVLEAIDKMSQETKAGCCVVLDEFQQITEVKNSLSVEGLMRSHIKKHNKTAYVFVGSRRTLLKDMFNEKKRPFYRSAMNYELKPLPDTELSLYIIKAFKRGGKSCPQAEAEKIVKLVNGYAYYAQKISYCVFECTESIVTPENVSEGLNDFLEEEKPYFEMMIAQLSVQQMRLIAALAKEPTKTPYGNEYMARHKLGSLSAIQGGIKKLVSIDFIDKQNEYYEVVDPLFKMWLIEYQN